MKPPDRCPWCLGDPLYQQYHDTEWGVPLHDDRALFEFLILEGAQAGLSWLTILRKRPHYRAAFAHFDTAAVARFGPADLERLRANPGIVRNRLKLQAAITNARACCTILDQFGSLDAFFWRFVDGQPIQNHWQSLAHVPAQTAISTALSKDLRQRGLKFVGPTICYAFMQATGMVNDHLTHCFRHPLCADQPKNMDTILGDRLPISATSLHRAAGDGGFCASVANPKQD